MGNEGSRTRDRARGPLARPTDSNLENQLILRSSQALRSIGRNRGDIPDRHAGQARWFLNPSPRRCPLAA